jgi:acetylglutamate/LysW-gamma-L-alpha-aminoadipate kinase
VVVRHDHSGRVVDVNEALLRILLDAGLTPVLSPPVLAEDGTPVNANADRVAASVAAAVRAHRLVFLTPAGGVRADASDPASILSRYRLPGPADGRDERIGGGMGIKLVAAGEALRAGVASVYIGRRVADSSGTTVSLPCSDSG